MNKIYKLVKVIINQQMLLVCFPVFVQDQN